MGIQDWGLRSESVIITNAWYEDQYYPVLDRTAPMGWERHVAMQHELCRMFVLDRNKRLSAENWRSIVPVVRTPSRQDAVPI